MGWLNVPVTIGAGPLPPTSATSGAGNQSAPTDLQSYEFWDQFYNALEEKSMMIGGCDAEFPPADTYYSGGKSATIDSVEIVSDEYTSDTLRLYFSNVDWHVSYPFSGERWAGYSAGSCFNYIPSAYDLIVITDYNDAYTWIRLPINSNTFDSGSSTGTMDCNILPAQNAVTAKFISSIDSMSGAQYRIVRQGTGMTSRDRRPLKPNQRELWRGSIDSGWIDTSGNGQIYEQRNIFDPDPYDTDGGPLPVINWKPNQFKNKEILFFDSTGLLRRCTIKNNINNEIGFGTNTAPTDPPEDATSIGGNYVICGVGDKGMPGRVPDPMFVWSRGVRQGYKTHNPLDDIGEVGKPLYSKDWPAGSPCAGGDCINVSHTTLDTDASYAIDDECNPGEAGLHLEPNFYKSPRALQLTALGMLGSFVDTTNPMGDLHGGGPNYFTPATWANEFSQQGAWTSTLSVDSGGNGSVSDPPFTVQNPPLGVYWTLQDEHEINIGSGTATVDEDGNIGRGWSIDQDGLTIFLWAGCQRVYRKRFKYLLPKGQWMPDCGINPTTLEDQCNDPPAITPGGKLADPSAPTLSVGQGGTLNYGSTYSYQITAVNGSGETLPSAEASIACIITTGTPPTTTTITTNTYSVKLKWTPEAGASSYNVYGRNGGGEVYLANVSAYAGEWIDDGSISMSGGASPPTSNTTATDCFGTGYWVFRDISTSALSVSQTGMVADGGPALVTNDLYRHWGDNWCDPFSGRGAITNDIDDASYWDRFYRGRRRKSIQEQRDGFSNGTIGYATKCMIFDASKHWDYDGLNSGVLRVQGGTLTTGGTSSVKDSDYNNYATSKACWFNPQRFVGSIGSTTATPYSYFEIEIYGSATPAGWTIAEDGTATYSAPTATGHTGTIVAGSPPTISGITPTPLHATGLPQPIFIQGNNFQASCTVVFTLPDSTTLTATPTTTTAGELTLSVTLPRGTSGSWSVVVSNHVGGASSAFNFTVKLMQSMPIASFASGQFNLFSALDTGAASADGYLINEYKYETATRHRGKIITTTSSTGTLQQNVCRYSYANTLYIDPLSAPLIGAYDLDEIETGATVKLSTSKPAADSGLQWAEAPPDGSTKRYWVQPTGSDSRGEPFKPDINANLETKVNDFGLYLMLDDVGAHIPNQLYAIIKVMKSTLGPSPAWHNYDISLTPQNNFNGREGGAGDDLDFARSSEIWSANYPPPDLVSPCTGVAGGEAHSYFLDGSMLDNTAPYGDATSEVATGGYVDCAANYSCCDQPSPLPLYNVAIDGSWIFAYPWVNGIYTCFTSTAKVYCFSPAWPDGDWDVNAPCACHCVDCYSCANPPETDANGDGCTGDCLGDYEDNGCYPNQTHVHKSGESLWIGGSVGLTYDGWAIMASLSGTDANRCGDKIGYEPTPIDPASILGDPNYIGDVSTGYSISNYLTIIEWSGIYV